MSPEAVATGAGACSGGEATPSGVAVTGDGAGGVRLRMEDARRTAPCS